MRTVQAAAYYWAAILWLGFVLGTLRTLWLTPRLGETRAVMVEVPFILAASWLIARPVMRRHAIRAPGEALAMGVIAFALLLAAEALMAIPIRGGISSWTTTMGSTPGLIGLGAQVCFALIPLAAWTLAHRRR